ncbi:MAG: DUF1294 domain-containing protein [Lachnospiraceae bacterium]|nr:DUF1294 domain-containing protein [Lachnospiraceae bacterium]
MYKAVAAYLILVNIISFLVMGLDKHRAKVHKWRVSEKTLFLLALLGGSAGSVLGIYTFHHKTRHWYFVWGMPAILFLQIVLGIVIIR